MYLSPPAKLFSAWLLASILFAAHCVAIESSGSPPIESPSLASDEGARRPSHASPDHPRHESPGRQPDQSRGGPARHEPIPSPFEGVDPPWVARGAATPSDVDRASTAPPGTSSLRNPPWRAATSVRRFLTCAGSSCTAPRAESPPPSQGATARSVTPGWRRLGPFLRVQIQDLRERWPGASEFPQPPFASGVDLSRKETRL